MSQFNVYADERRADAYARLAFAGTYHLAFRDLPAILAEHVRGRRALDFGCGAGRSTRFLRTCGFDVIGVDIAPQMIAKARELDPGGDYRLVAEGDLGALDVNRFDVVLSVFTFDNVRTRELKVSTSVQMRRLLADAGRIVHVVSSPEMYTHEWASISTKDFPENRHAKPGDVVRTIITDTGDWRAVDDIFCPDDEYAAIFSTAGLDRLATYRPLGRGDEPFTWVSETRIAPWTIYVLSADLGARGSTAAPLT